MKFMLALVTMTTMFMKVTLSHRFSTQLVLLQGRVQGSDCVFFPHWTLFSGHGQVGTGGSSLV